jgi:hypothetical protein
MNINNSSDGPKKRPVLQLDQQAALGFNGEALGLPAAAANSSGRTPSPVTGPRPIQPQLGQTAHAPLTMRGFFPPSAVTATTTTTSTSVNPALLMGSSSTKAPSRSVTRDPVLLDDGTLDDGTFGTASLQIPQQHRRTNGGGTTDPSLQLLGASPTEHLSTDDTALFASVLAEQAKLTQQQQRTNAVLSMMSRGSAAAGASLPTTSVLGGALRTDLFHNPQIISSNTTTPRRLARTGSSQDSLASSGNNDDDQLTILSGASPSASPHRGLPLMVSGNAIAGLSLDANNVGLRSMSTPLAIPGMPLNMNASALAAASSSTSRPQATASATASSSAGTAPGLYMSQSFPGTAASLMGTSLGNSVESTSSILMDLYINENPPLDRLSGHAMVMEKRRKRRESHNAVERRRRDNINDRIQELALVVPDCQTVDGIRTNKGDILKNAIGHIRALTVHQEDLLSKMTELQKKNEELTRRNLELEARVVEDTATSTNGAGLSDTAMDTSR